MRNIAQCYVIRVAYLLHNLKKRVETLIREFNNVNYMLVAIIFISYMYYNVIFTSCTFMCL